MSARQDTLLLVADSDHNANMLYATRMFAPDPFIYLRAGGKPLVVISDLEIDRARREADGCCILPLARCLRRLKAEGVERPGFARVIALLLRERRLRKVFVPPEFPHGLARQLRDLGVKIRVKEGGVFPEREHKCADEVKKISAAIMMAEVGLAEAVQVLKNSRIGRDRRLIYHNNPLTSEKLQATINIAVIQAGGATNRTIVAGGRQACDPHERGHGVLRAHEPIVLDIFPRSQATGYFGDITRTVVRGRASEAVRHLYETVKQGQEIAFKELRPGAKGADVHARVQEFFKSAGYKTRRQNGRLEGFFHGTGHGLGVEIHEAPRLNATSADTLRAGHVVTVEPGLYYPAVGGVRLEDVALVTHGGARNLTKFEKVLEI